MNGESCDGSIVRNKTNQTIVDANNETWTLSFNNTVFKSGNPAGYSEAVIKLVYWNRTIYQENNNNLWWGWINGGWIATTDYQLLQNLVSASGCMLSTLAGIVLNAFYKI